MDGFEIKDGVLVNYRVNETAVVIPDGVTSIDYGTFDGCENLQSILSTKIPIETWDSSERKRAAAFGYLQNRELFLDADIAASYKKYAIGQRKKLLPVIFKNDAAAALAFYAEEKKITAANFEEDYLNPAQAANAKECVAFLLNWQNQNITVEDIEKKMEKELMKDPYNTADMKKLWSYEKLEDGTLCLTGYKGEETNVTVPPYIGKTAVSRLGDCVFSITTANGGYKPQQICENLEKIESIFIGDNITSIGNSAFYGCTSLQSITIPDSVTSIGEKSLSYCEKLQSVTIPDSVTSIGDWVFDACESLQSITIPDSVTSIGYGVFYLCESLQSITIPDGVTSIGDWAFYECKSLQGITIPDSVTSIGDGVFYLCESLQSITIPDGVTSIGNEAFYLCTSLQSILSPTITIESWASSEQERAAVLGYLQNRELFLDADIAASYKKYAIGQRKKILPVIFKNDATSALAFYAEEKKITSKNFEEEYLHPAQAADAKECVAFLLDFRDNNMK